jgi:hypothetical protein
LVADLANEIAQESPSRADRFVNLTIGLVNLSGHLIVMLEKSGQPIDEPLSI